MTKETQTSGGSGLCTLLLVAFIVLKLCGVINWSWWWVLSPAWIPLAVVALFLIPYLVKGIKARQKVNRVIDIMNKTGKNQQAALEQYYKERGITSPKSKWQERIEEMQRQHQEMKRKREELNN